MKTLEWVVAAPLVTAPDPLLMGLCPPVTVLPLQRPLESQLQKHALPSLELNLEE